MNLPTLYKRTSTGALQCWTVRVVCDSYRTIYGQIPGTQTVSEWTVCVGKQGRTNAEQTLFEAEALWTKKLKKDYTKDPNVQAGDKSDLIEGGILPMLAHKYQDHKTKVKWPAYAQRKLDGVRCIAVVDAAGKCTLWTRTRKPILSMPHIIASVEAQAKPGTILDGELFAPDFHARFEELMSLIRASYAKDNCAEVQYWVYDRIVDGVPFDKRKDLFVGYSAPVVPVETILVPDEETMRELFAQYIEGGFEGLILRSRSGLYVGKRSVDLLKVKERDDSEYEVVGVVEGKGKLQGHGIFELKTPEGKEFKAKMRGATEALRDIWDHPDKYLGAKVTVAYQGLTSEGIPRFPVALRVRESLD